VKIRYYENGKLVRVEDAAAANPSPSIPRLGDKVAAAIAKIPGIKKLPCYDETGKLKPETPCGKARQRLNAGEPIIPTIIKRIKGS
jgi:hypothetical protein